MKFLFFIMGLPVMIMSFFEAVDVVPYASESSLLIDGKEIVLTQEQNQDLLNEVEKLFQSGHTVPAFGVVFDEMYKDEIKEGQFVKLKFSNVFEINGLPFDELVFKICPDYHGFNLMRGMNGVFQGRCIYIDLHENTMEDFCRFVNSLDCVKEIGKEKDVETENSDLKNKQEIENISNENV